MFIWSTYQNKAPTGAYINTKILCGNLDKKRKGEKKTNGWF